MNIAGDRRRPTVAPTRWAILTGAYPPQPGGVSDYTRLVAVGLAATGDDVHVFAPPCHPSNAADPGVTVHRLPDCFGSRGLAALDRALVTEGRLTRVLLQYVPHAFGQKAMNVGLCAWLYRRRSCLDISTMFHEVSYPWAFRQPPQHNFLATVNRGMAYLLTRASRRILVSTTAWQRTLRPLLGPRQHVEPAPIPSNVAVTVDLQSVAKIRGRMGPCVVGHFGSYGPAVAPLLRSVIPPILNALPEAQAMLIGRGAGAFIAGQHESIRDRMTAAEDLSPQDAATHLAACDVMVQPYPDGVTTRRGSVMAPLALGVPVATTDGVLTEPLWREGGVVALAPAGEMPSLGVLATSLLRDPARRAAQSAAGASLYSERFALSHTIALLRQSPRGRL